MDSGDSVSSTSETGYRYSFFGFNLLSNVRLPEVPTENSKAAADISVHFSATPEPDLSRSEGAEELFYVSPYKTQAGESILKIWKTGNGELWHLIYCDETQFWIDKGQRRIWATWPESLSLESTVSYLLGPVLGLVLRLRGVTCLHASAVAFGDGCAAFVGPERAGKSTTAAAFAKNEHAVLSDDIVALSEKDGLFSVLPAYPHVCLWPDAVDKLYGSPDALPRFSLDWEKRRLALGTGNTRFETRTLPLKAIYLLGERRAERGPEIEEISSSAGLLSLVANTYATNFLDRDMRATEFATLGRLASRVPVRSVHAHPDSGRIDDLCRLIQSDLEGLSRR